MKTEKTEKRRKVIIHEPKYTMKAIIHRKAEVKAEVKPAMQAEVKAEVKADNQTHTLTQ